MKNLLVVFMFLLTTVALPQSQTDSITKKSILGDMQLSSVEVSSGKGAVTSGLYMFVNMESERAVLTATISQNDLEITYLYRLFKDKLFIGPNAGFFFNVPYGGPMIVFSPVKYISTLHWFGGSFGKPGGEIALEPSFLFAVNSLTINVWRLNATYCLINYMENEPQHTVSLKYSQPINKHFSIYTDIGYDFLNQNQLLKIGIYWKR
jgi:hypothetical protein